MHGSPAHRPLDATELVEWLAYDEITHEEQERLKQQTGR